MNNLIEQYQKQINIFLEQSAEQFADQKILQQSMKYSVLAGGKRLRPALTLAVLDAFNKPVTNQILKAACAVELLHTYSLIHDDLPAMDNDDLRRGKPTNHVKFGAGMATLAGDGLLTLAFQWLVDNQLTDQRKAKLTFEMSKAAGPTAMVAGQAIDISNEGKRLSLPQLQNLHQKKTGALLRYSLIAGGILSEQSESVIDDLGNFGADFGLAFQIYDDLMDVVASTAQMGKRTKKDHEEHKNTYPELLGIDGTKSALASILDQCHSDLKAISAHTGQEISSLSQFLTYFEV